MRKILYICTKNQYDWNSFIPEEGSSPPERDLSVLLLQDGLSLRHIPTSQVFVLKTAEENGDDLEPYKKISHLDFLEKIFSADLALVI